MAQFADGSSQLARLGLARLSLRLPSAKRDALRATVMARPILNELFEAYEEASVALEKFRRRPHIDASLINEYEAICAEIERDLMSEIDAGS
jgi:hypothetical protein